MIWTLTICRLRRRNEHWNAAVFPCQSGGLSVKQAFLGRGHGRLTGSRPAVTAGRNSRIVRPAMGHHAAAAARRTRAGHVEAVARGAIWHLARLQLPSVRALQGVKEDISMVFEVIGESPIRFTSKRPRVRIGVRNSLLDGLLEDVKVPLERVGRPCV